MTRPSRWPTFCRLRGCDHPSRRPHHHHRIDGQVVPAVCECADVDRPDLPGLALRLPGTRPERPAKVSA